jgi:hypothetical protein
MPTKSLAERSRQRILCLFKRAQSGGVITDRSWQRLVSLLERRYEAAESRAYGQPGVLGCYTGCGPPRGPVGWVCHMPVRRYSTDHEESLVKKARAATDDDSRRKLLNTWVAYARTVINW